MKRIATVLATATGIWALLALPAPALAQEAQFTLNATVDLKSLHEDVTAFVVSCFVCSAAPCDGQISTDVIGSTATNFDTNGAFNVNQQVQILVNAREGNDPRDVVVYRCAVFIQDQGPAGRGPTFDSAFPFAVAKEGSQLVNVLTGDIVQ
ncbi:MAG: hypothetical protein IH994_01295 [Proteobacteria bacterium]|nr:hypothetical protein [Pseudomonadota bacterium]